ncbi:conserved hypothetical protein [Tenacibaculum sp. 190524A05c]|uniref:hypothetical protein n=1 Tax=Tenacibaculum platacis TaxID=3137852 RepID=UPI0031FAE2DB
MIRFISIVSFFFLFISCQNKTVKSHPKQSVKNKTSIEVKNSKESDVVISLSEFLYENKTDEIQILNQDGTIHSKLKRGKYSFNKSDFNLIEIDESTYENPIHSIIFYPEYLAWYVLAKKKGNKFIINSKDGDKFIENSNVQFYSIESFLRKFPIGLTTQSPLRKEKLDSSNEIEDFLNYDYRVIEVNEDWIKVKLNPDTPPGEKSYKELGLTREGWVKWKRENEILIKFFLAI